MAELHQDVNQIPSGNPTFEGEEFGVDEIIGNSPGWILHSGMTVLLIVVSICIALSIVIRYPDKVKSSGIITTTDPYKTLYSRSFGIIDTVYADHKEFIWEGEPVLYIQNPANQEDVRKVLDLLTQMDLQDYAVVDHPDLNEELALGSMQSIYASLMQIYREYVHYLRRTDFSARIEVIDREIQEIHLWNDVLEKERALSKSEISLSQKDLDRNQILFRQGIISERELERSIASHLGIQKNYLLKANNISQNRVRIVGLEQQKVDVHAQRNEKILLYQSRIDELIHNFRNAYKIWYQQYFIIAPAGGMFQMSPDIVQGQTLEQGQSVGYLIPYLPDSIQHESRGNSRFARIWVASSGLGKIKKGNRVILHIDAYPSKEYGTLETFVQDIYPVAQMRENQPFYEIHLPLYNELVTDHDYPVQYRPDMTIQAIIITKERSLFNRVFDQFLHLTNLHVS